MLILLGCGFCLVFWRGLWDGVVVCFGFFLGVWEYGILFWEYVWLWEYWGGWDWGYFVGWLECWLRCFWCFFSCFCLWGFCFWVCWVLGLGDVWGLRICCWFEVFSWFIFCSLENDLCYLLCRWFYMLYWWFWCFFGLVFVGVF